MTTSEFKISSCKSCRHYCPEGRRGGQCAQFGTLVHAGWKACPLAMPAFAPSWETLERFTTVGVPAAAVPAAVPAAAVPTVGVPAVPVSVEVAAIAESSPMAQRVVKVVKETVAVERSLAVPSGAR
ncbi:MAG: hypothetical protein MH825_10505 [Cyanobacteria bacterium]|nr:hypothetical protein [Cyanobacteriota bacterium]